MSELEQNIKERRITLFLDSVEHITHELLPGSLMALRDLRFLLLPESENDGTFRGGISPDEVIPNVPAREGGTLFGAKYLMKEMVEIFNLGQFGVPHSSRGQIEELSLSFGRMLKDGFKPELNNYDSIVLRQGSIAKALSRLRTQKEGALKRGETDWFTL